MLSFEGNLLTQRHAIFLTRN